MCLIYNPTEHTEQRVQDFRNHLSEPLKCDMRAMSGANAGELAREAVSNGVERIIVGGGDGTLHRVVEAIAPQLPDVEIALLPLGTGNDFARSIGLYVDQFAEACHAAVGSRTEAIDVVLIESETRTSCFINVANGGLGGHVTVDVTAEDKKRWGQIAYWMHALSHLVDLDTYQLQLTLDDRELKDEAHGLVIANGRFIGGGFPIAPQAQLNDGLMDVAIVPLRTRLELMSAGMNLVLGRAEQDDRIQYHRCRKLVVKSTPPMRFSVDGEPSEAFDATFEVLPNALPIAVGEEAPGLQS